MLNRVLALLYKTRLMCALFIRVYVRVCDVYAFVGVWCRGIATRLWAGRSGVRIPIGVEDFSIIVAP
jgi:hypothetical protein